MTLRNWTWVVINAITELEMIHLVHRFLDHEDNGIRNIFMSVDGTDCPIQELQPFSAPWFSHKINHAALRYEVGVSTAGGDIVWVCGPYPSGSYPDVVKFCDDLKHRVREGENVITDIGYIDAKEMKQSDEPGKEEYHRAVRGHQEGVNGRLKRFKVLTTTFSHKKDQNGIFFFAVANIAQVAINVKEPLFHISAPSSVGDEA